MTEPSANEDYLPIQASGPGADLFDEPALFYLTHQKVIEEWHALRRSVSEAVDEWFDGPVRDALAPLASAQHLQLSRVEGPASHSALLLHPEDMPVLAGKPVLGVGVAWPRKSVNPRSNQPFVCVRATRRREGRRTVKAFLDGGGRSLRSTKAVNGNDDSSWLLWSYITASPQWWTDLESYLSQVVSAVSDLAEASAPLLRSAAEVKPATDLTEPLDVDRE